MVANPGTTSDSARSEDVRGSGGVVDFPSQCRASDDPGKGEPASRSEHVDDRRGQVPQTHRFLDDLLGRGATRGNDQKGNVQLGLIETGSVAENAGVLAETFPVVRSDDQPGSVQNTAPPQLVQQLPDLFIEVRDAIVVSIDGKR